MKNVTHRKYSAACFTTLVVIAAAMGARVSNAQLTYTTGLDVWLDAADIDGLGNSTLIEGAAVTNWLNKGTTGVMNAVSVGSSGLFNAGVGPGGVDVVNLNNTRYQFGQEFVDTPNVTMYFRVFRNSATSSANSTLYTDYGTNGNELLTIRAGNSVSGARDAAAAAIWVNDGMVQANNTWATIFYQLDATAKQSTYGELGNLNMTTNAAYNSSTTFAGTFGGPATLFSFHNGDNTHDFNGFVSEVLIFDHLLDASAKSQVESYLANKAGVGIFEPSATIDRDTGILTLANEGALAASVIGYSFTSAIGALDQSNWDSIASTGDFDSGMDIDPDDKWTEYTEAGVFTDLSEGQLGGPGPGDGFMLSSANPLVLGDVWLKSPVEDVALELLLADGSSEFLPVEFTGHGGTPFLLGDLNFQDGVTAADWIIYRNNFRGSLAGLSSLQGYPLGDMDLDGDNDWDDFDLFKTAYNDANGAGAFELMVSSAHAVPEPRSAAVLVLLAPAALLALRRKRSFATRGGTRPSHPNATSTMNRNAISILVAMVAAITIGSPSNVAANTFDATIGSTAVTVVEVDPFKAGDTPGNTVRADNSGTPWANVGGTGSDSLWTERAYSAFFTGYASLPGATDRVFEVSQVDVTGAPALRTTVTGLPPALYQVFEVFTTRADANTDDGRIRAALNGNVVTSGTNYNWENKFDTLAGATSTWTTSIANLGLTPAGSTGFFVEVSGVNATGRDHHVAVAYRVLPQLTLEVDTQSGDVWLANNSGTSISLDGYEIASTGGLLNFGNWNSLQDQDYEGSGAPGDGLGFEELGTPTGSFLNEAILVGSAGYTFVNNESVNIGKIYGSASVGDLSFRIRTSSGTFIPGLIEVVTSDGVSGDYNGDGIVNLADYTVWRDNLGASITLPNEGSGVSTGVVDAADYTHWKSRFGATSGSASLSTAVSVPEPSSLLLMLGAFGVILWMLHHWRERVERMSVQRVVVPNRTVRTVAHGIVVSIVAWAVLGSAALATVTADRLFLFGDTGSADALEGASIGEGSSMGFEFFGNYVTADEIGPSGGGYADLTVTGTTYTSTSARTGVTGDYGARFIGASSTFLRGVDDINQKGTGGLGFPGSSPRQNPAVNYTNIFTRGIQLWAYPTNSTSGVRQDVINDTYQFGIHITDTNRWGMTWGSTSGSATGRVIDSAESVVFNTWTHVMQHSFGSSGSVLYVNGNAVAVSGFNGAQFYQPNLSTANLNQSLGANLTGSGNYFTGVLDDVQVYVAGNNETGTPGVLTDGENWGTFNLATDNEYIASLNLVPGDATGEGNVDELDIDVFLDHWLDTQIIGTAIVGDLYSRQNQADFNFDGRTSLADAYILHQALLLNGSVGFDFSLLNGERVPEPTALLPVALAIAGFLLGRRRI